jgi:hypothetical protein
MQNVIKIPKDLAKELDLLAQAERKRRTPYVVDLQWRDVRRKQAKDGLKAVRRCLELRGPPGIR